MADDQKRPAKKVVKKVVKKAPASNPQPTVRYGRPVAPAAKVQSPPAKSTKAPKSKPSKFPEASVAVKEIEDQPTNAAVDTETARKRPSLPKPNLPKPALRKPNVDLGSTRERMAGFGSGAVAIWRRIIAAVTDAFWWVADGVSSLRLPKLQPVPGALGTGLIVGLIAVGLGVGALELFEWLRGVASGGGTWGSLTFVFVGFIAFALGERLLDGFGIPWPRLTSLLGVIMTVVVMLGVYLEESDTRLAFLIVPAIAATSYTVAHWLMAAAEADDATA